MLTPTRPHGVAAPGSDGLVGDLLSRVASDRHATPAVVDGDHILTYDELYARARSFAAGLRQRGFGAGDVALLQLPNWWETVVAAWGTWLAGGVVLPVVAIYRRHELSFVVRQVRPRVAVAPEGHRGHRHAALLREVLAEAGVPATVVVVRGPGGEPDAFEALAASAPARDDPAPEPGPDDVALVLYTSGTTADPKGVLHTHRTLLAELAAMREHCELGPDDRVFMPSPLTHVTGISYGVLLPAGLGATSVLMDRWDPAVAVDVVERHECRFTVSATPFLRGLTTAYAERGTRSALRTFVCGGADIPPELVEEAQRVLGCAVLRTYGSSELPTLAMVPLDRGAALPDVEGHVMCGAEMILRESEAGVPELLARAPELFVGYLDPALNAAAFTDDGWFRTGDTATIRGGVLRVVGRIKEIINRGGEKYSAAEVEFALLDHPDVEEVAIVGFPDPELGERACAFVVPRNGAAPDVATLREHLVAHGLAVQKAPERVVVIDALPRTSSGKVQKFLLRGRIGAQPPPERRSESEGGF
ncbi:AMP-binding protein [Nocardioides sp. YIM 152315]|uniref:AMP-binding protein n=1 Tax=Nocardioides sp. YIM 152315 TaxID=3031760 RepID=UPI0023DB8401|nr:AMP-binding protein [Nocardioides sp. YIM 152315]MDF1603742.1 AMP-binding protein [Nocardioides sp. YIM 152315]